MGEEMSMSIQTTKTCDRCGVVQVVGRDQKVDVSRVDLFDQTFDLCQPCVLAVREVVIRAVLKSGIDKPNVK